MSFTPEELEINESDDEQYYEDVYFDSDLDNETSEVDNEQNNPTEIYSIKKSRKKLTKDELFYDPEIDNDDEIWMKKKLAQYNTETTNQTTTNQTTKEITNQTANQTSQTDAILSCPMCFTVLSYHTQRPANSDIELDVKSDDTIKEEIYYPVECEICRTKVAVVDEEEVFHFFNVIPS
ncbi:3073_t:CDS:2 [Dentiscutata erythropus]|uniref:3073_t:CDS:1 n=1 Tax=Dentiscutata erythropus TaxID=1348616 RepID=A0A9N9BDM2_9GLOM|nr:3073_t:CDS:2 [Dentiscutata erythropus]